MHIYPFPGEVTQAEHAALQDITKPNPYEALMWKTAMKIVEERQKAALENMRSMKGLPEYEYFRGRYEALRDCSDEMWEREKP